MDSEENTVGRISAEHPAGGHRLDEHMAEKILVIDDDISLNELLTTYLSGFGFEVHTASNPVSALERLKEQPVDLIILDVMMPDMDGFAVLKALRETSRVPVIMLTACGDLTDRVVGLELGADDYLPKPFEPRELLARVRSVLRRYDGRRPDNGETADPGHGLALHPESKQALLNGAKLDLTTMEYDLLELLAAHKGRVLSRDFIMDRLKGYEWEAYDRSIDIAVSRLRAKLGDTPSDPRFIKTVRGAGYMFIG